MENTLEARTDRQLKLARDRARDIADRTGKALDAMAGRGATPDEMFAFAAKIAGTLAVPLAVIDRRVHP